MWMAFWSGVIDERVVQDRERLAQDGFVVVNVPINKQRRLAGEPLILTRGFLHSNESDELMETALAELKRSFKSKRSEQPTEPLRSRREDPARFLLCEDPIPSGDPV